MRGIAIVHEIGKSEMGILIILVLGRVTKSCSNTYRQSSSRPDVQHTVRRATPAKKQSLPLAGIGGANGQVSRRDLGSEIDIGLFMAGAWPAG